jgi:hypothetical protein
LPPIPPFSFAQHGNFTTFQDIDFRNLQLTNPTYMQKEFMLCIRNAGDAKTALTPEQHLAFVKECEVYIGELKANDNLIAAQPIVREGITLSKMGNDWKSIPIDPNREVQVGYYHIAAANIEEAIAIAKRNPEFSYVPSASIEVRPIRTKEEKTNFVYPKG